MNTCTDGDMFPCSQIGRREKRETSFFIAEVKVAGTTADTRNEILPHTKTAIAS
jgi:hypothetical protein